MNRIQQALVIFVTLVILVIIAGLSGSKLIAMLVLFLAMVIWIAGKVILFLTRLYRKSHSVTRSSELPR